MAVPKIPKPTRGVPPDPEQRARTQFQPGNQVSANRADAPPKWKRLVTTVLKEKLARWSVSEKRTYAELLADRLVRCALEPNPDEDKFVIMAISEIVDRTEGKAKQQLDVNDVTQQVSERSDEDLKFFIEHGRWPEEKASILQ